MVARAAAGRAGAVVIGGGHVGLGVVRSLGRRDVPVVLLDAPRSLAASSRYVTALRAWPAGDEQRVDFLLDLGRRLDRGRRWVLFPTDDEAVSLLARHHALLSQRHILTVPPWETVRLAHDKVQTYRLASELNIPVPATLVLAQASDLTKPDLAYPVIVKPANSWLMLRRMHKKALLARNADELVAQCRRLADLLRPDEILVQEVIEGGGETQFSFAALCDGGRVVASITAQRIRQMPRDFGHNSTFVQTVSDERVEALARRFLEAMRYSGLAEVEFKYDRLGDRYKLLDVNTRPWGWHTLGPRAGVDFCYLSWLQAQRLPLPASCGKTGVRWMREIADPLVAAAELLSGDLSPGRYIGSFSPPIEFAVLARDDPMPVVRELGNLISYAPHAPELWRRYFG